MKHFGTVQSFNETTGHGFIRPENGGKDLSFERSEILWDPGVSPRPGVRLSYRLSGRNGEASAIDLQTVQSVPRRPQRKSFSVFRSAAEEASTKAQREEWENEGGHMSCTSGQARHIAGAELPYVVTMKHPHGEATEHPFATMRESEAFINRNTPASGDFLRCGSVVESDVLTCAWRHFGEAVSTIAFLNTPNDQLEGRPLHLALESAEGLIRVEKLLQKS